MYAPGPNTGNYPNPVYVSNRFAALAHVDTDNELPNAHSMASDICGKPDEAHSNNRARAMNQKDKHWSRAAIQANVISKGIKGNLVGKKDYQTCK